LPVTFDYPNEEQYSMNVQSSRKPDQSVLLKTQTRSVIQYEASTLVKRLLVLTETLPMLPKVRFLVMRLTYRPGTPEDYEPSYFEPSSGTQIKKQGTCPERSAHQAVKM